MNGYALLFARVALAPLYLVSGINKLLGWPGVAGAIASKGLPLSPLLGAATIGIEVIGGLLLLIGFATRLAAAALLGFTLLASLFFHDFWAYAGADFSRQLTQFLKNLGLMGGLALIAVQGAGAFGLESSMRGRRLGGTLAR